MGHQFSVGVCTTEVSSGNPLIKQGVRWGIGSAGRPIFASL
jgi:hypothetical protein